MKAASVLLTLALACINSILFPLVFGYPGGTVPLPEGWQAILPYFVLAAINLAVLFFLKTRSSDSGISFRYLLLLAAFTRIAYFVTRSLWGATQVDLDTELFFDYGREFAAGRYPAMEYPQAALLLFTVAYRLALGNLAYYRLLFPLLMLPFDLLVLASLQWLGKRYSTQAAANALGLVYAISPFTLVHWYGKYDMAPAALLALGVTLFATHRRSLSALFLGIGFLTKWIPGIAIPFFVAYLWRSREPRAAFKYAAIAAATIVLPLTVFWLISPTKVIYPYAFQSARPAMGSSMLYIPVYFFEPDARLGDDSPWTPFHSSLLSNDLAAGILLAGQVLILLPLILARVKEQSAVILAALGVAVFIVLNRAYSPQYIILLFVAYALGFLAIPPGSRILAIADLVLLVLTFLNYLVWPLWADSWFLYSLLFFALNLIVIAWLGYYVRQFERQVLAS